MGKSATINIDSNAKDALESGEIYTVFETQQPLTQEGVVVGCESLVRGRTSEGGEIRPDKLVTTALATQTLRKMHMIVVQDSLKLAHDTGLSISVNMHPKLLRETGIIEEMNEARRDAGMQKGQVTVEILENASRSDLKKVGGDNLAKLVGAKPLDNGELADFETAADDFPNEHSLAVYRRLIKLGKKQQKQSDDEKNGVKKRPVLKVDFHTTLDLFSEDENKRQCAEDRIRQAAGFARKGAKLVIEGVEPGQTALRERIKDLIQGILTEEKVFLQVGRPEPTETIRQILSGETEIRAHGE